MKHCFFSMTYHYESFYSFSKCYSLNVVIKNVPVINVLINNMRFKVNCLHRNVLSLLCSLKNLCTSDLLFLSSLFCTKLVLYITILAPFYCLSSLGLGRVDCALWEPFSIQKKAMWPALHSDTHYYPRTFARSFLWSKTTWEMKKSPWFYGVRESNYDL